MRSMKGGGATLGLGTSVRNAEHFRTRGAIAFGAELTVHQNTIRVMKREMPPVSWMGASENDYGCSMPRQTPLICLASRRRPSIQTLVPQNVSTKNHEKRVRLKVPHPQSHPASPLSPNHRRRRQRNPNCPLPRKL